VKIDNQMVNTLYSHIECDMIHVYLMCVSKLPRR